LRERYSEAQLELQFERMRLAAERLVAEKNLGRLGTRPNAPGGRGKRYFES
jgi:hypothetical protein